LGGSVFEARRRKRVFKLEASGGHRICISTSVSSSIAGHCGAGGQIDGLTPAGNISGQHQAPFPRFRDPHPPRPEIR